ncbi:C-5 cytosine methyltransferase [Penicillium herquei]|nr:C-5 cytosine methyltransferase [Penicillium herquei]
MTDRSGCQTLQTALTSDWKHIKPEKAQEELQEIMWTLQRIGDLSAFEKWRPVQPTSQIPMTGSICQDCRPRNPGLLWGVDNRGKVMPYEDPQEAAVWERAVKNKAPPFLMFQSVSENGSTQLQFALNLQVMAHIGFGKFPEVPDNKTVEFKWRLVSNVYDVGRKRHPRFTLRDNLDDVPHSQPPNFLFDLRSEQLRSLTWMVSQEAEDIEPFVDEEVEEASLSLMGWRAEVHISVPQVVRGGLIADQVGYGKTAIVLGLIDSQFKADKARNASRLIAPHTEGLISTYATLLVVPSNVFEQWHGEIKKFLGKKYKILMISNVMKLRGLSIRDIQSADIVLVSWAIFTSPAYYQLLRLFTGVPKVPNKGSSGRAFDCWFQEAKEALRDRIRTLTERGVDEFVQELLERFTELKKVQDDASYIPSRRLRGAAFARANQKSQQAQRESQQAEAEVQKESEEAEEYFEETQEDPSLQAGNKRKSAPSSSKASSSKGKAKAKPNPKPRAKPKPNPKAKPKTTSKGKGKARADPEEEDHPVPDDGKFEADDERDEGDHATHNADEGNDQGWSELQNAPGDIDDDSESDKDQKTKGKRPNKSLNYDKDTFPESEIRAAFKILSKDAPEPSDMKCPFFHAFHFNRIVIDEFTYAREDKQVCLRGLSARSKWIMSGTPGLRDFADIKTIAQHLGVHLGIDDDGDAPSQSDRLKAERRNLTLAEKFQMYQPARTNDWHMNRHYHAQRFLNKFARQNVAEIAQIPVETHVLLSQQYEAERLTYDVMYQRLDQANSSRSRKIHNPDNDLQIEYVNKLFSVSKAASEALVKACVTVRIWNDVYSLEKCEKKLEALAGLGLKRETKLKSLIAEQVLHEIRNTPNSQAWEGFRGTIFSRTNVGDKGTRTELLQFISDTVVRFTDENAEIPEDIRKSFVQRTKKALPQASKTKVRTSTGGRSSIGSTGNSARTRKTSKARSQPRRRSSQTKGKKPIEDTAEDSAGPTTAEDNNGNPSKGKPQPRRRSSRATGIQSFDGTAEDPSDDSDYEKVCKDQSSPRKKKKTSPRKEGRPTEEHPPTGDQPPSEDKASAEENQVIAEYNDLDPAKKAKTESSIAASMQKDITTARNDYVQNVCNIRFWSTMKSIQLAVKQQISPVTSCSRCTAGLTNFNDITILSSCGHVLCKTCLAKCDAHDEAEESDQEDDEPSEATANNLGFSTCSVRGCTGTAKLACRLDGISLDSDFMIKQSRKLTALLELLHSIPDDEQVILFVQFDDIMTMVNRALEFSGIEFRAIRSGRLTGLNDFIKGSKDPSARPVKVLILPLRREMAAGLNLQNANHLVFIAPMDTDNQHDYIADMTQAIGRARRYGQKRTVNIYHMLHRATSDVEIMQRRRNEVIIERNGRAMFVPGEEVLDSDVAVESQSLGFVESLDPNYELGFDE